MAVYPNRGAYGASNLALEGNWVQTYDPRGATPGLDCIDSGAVALRRSLLSEIEDGAVWDLGALWSKLARRRKLRALLVPERSYEIGSAEGRAELARHLAAEAVQS